jgi:CBS domain-containing protein
MASIVADIMTASPRVLHEEDNLAMAIELMAQSHVRHLPVVDGKRLVGLVSHTDVLRFSLSELRVQSAVGASIERRMEQDTFVAQLMTRNPVSVTPQTPLADAARILRDSKFGCLPVVKDGELVGIVTETDFFAVLVSLLPEIAM